MIQLSELNADVINSTGPRQFVRSIFYRRKVPGTKAQDCIQLSAWKGPKESAARMTGVDLRPGRTPGNLYLPAEVLGAFGAVYTHFLLCIQENCFELLVSSRCRHSNSVYGM